MAIQVKCDCGMAMRVRDDAAGKKVRCPMCQGIVLIKAPEVEPDFEIVEDEPDPPKPTAKKPLRAVAAVVADDEDEDEKPKKKPKPKKKTKKATRSDADDDDEPTSAFWKTKPGMILNGIGLIGLGGAATVLYFLDELSEMYVLIGGIVTIGVGIGGVITGLTMSPDAPPPRKKKRRRDEDEDEEEEEDDDDVGGFFDDE
jgi:hypothetical protein